MITKILARMYASKIATEQEIKGCSEDEIALLERKCKVILPKSYREYLQVMGHESGRLFTSDHMAVQYEYVVNMTQDFSPYGQGAGMKLPDSSILIADRLGEYYNLIKCDSAEDSAVWSFSSIDWEIRKTYGSVYEWLDAWCTMAETAVNSGYFDLYPKGTTP